MAIGLIPKNSNPFSMTLKSCSAIDSSDEKACMGVLDMLDVLASPAMAHAITNMFDDSGRCTLAALLRGVSTLPVSDAMLPMVKARLEGLRLRAAELIQERE